MKPLQENYYQNQQYVIKTYESDSIYRLELCIDTTQNKLVDLQIKPKVRITKEYFQQCLTKCFM